MEVHRLGWSRTLGKKIVPSVGVLFRTRFAQELLSFVEVGAQILQGKGAGTGWDEEAETRVAIPHLPKDAVVFDVGANQGDWSRNLLSRVKHPIRLFLFEPQASCGPALADLSDRCTIVQAALGRAGGEIELFSAGAMDDTASVYQRADSFLADKPLHRQTVPVMSLDAFVDENAIKHISYMKLDVEGHELSVLEGARALLPRIEVIVSEFWMFKIDGEEMATFTALVTWLDQAGFVLYDIGALHGRSSDNRLQSGDAVFVRRNSTLVANSSWA